MRLFEFGQKKGCVNSVKWSHNGQYLASGADDKLVMIWQYTHV
jgi:WD40 repeat protein